ncbi:MAG: LysR family transcriptional regulator [Pseudomonadales bacterium]
MDWDDFKFVQAVARAGSVRGASDELHVHPSTVTRHLEQLEQRLGTRLFARTRRGMDITPAGGAVIEALDRVAAELDQVERSLQAREVALAGTVGLALPQSLAVMLVLPGIEPFLRDHPDIALTVVAGAPLEQLERGHADVALCLTDEPPGALVGRSLGPVMACVYGRRIDLEGASGSGIQPVGRWVGSSAPGMASRRRARSFADWPERLAVDDDALAAAAIASGLGFGWLPCYLGDALPSLARAMDSAPVRMADLWLVSRPETRGVARVQALSESVQRLLVGLAPRLSGTAPPEAAT